MEGENEDTNNPKALTNKSPGQRMIIFIAGAFMNVVLTWVLMVIFLTYSGNSYNSTVIENVVENFPLEQAGVMTGDTILAIDGVEVFTQTEISEIIGNNNPSYELTIKDIAGNIRIVTIAPQIDENGNRLIGFYGKVISEPYSFGESILQAFNETGKLLTEVVMSFWSLITGGVSVKDMAGIVGVAQLTTQVWDVSVQESVMYAIMNMVKLAAILSANLAVLNLLPFPALDGGRILFTFIELVRGKPLNQEKEAAFHFVGFVLLMILMVVVLYNDIVRILM
ncbi:RIP metalloprotease RseP [Epulopiscium sp. SCG-B10WGA-EpuloA2]|nr:RIP metalloprotease RseP [Epulopiscium sp. SCG-B10WGA-EpuloA2]